MRQAARDNALGYALVIPWVIFLGLYFAAYFGQLTRSPRPDAPHGGFTLSRTLTSLLGVALSLGLAWVLRPFAVLYALAALSSALALALPYLFRGELEVNADGLKVRVPAHARAWNWAQGAATALIASGLLLMLRDLGSIPLPGR